MSVTRRKPATITYKLLRCIAENGEARKWDLTKIVGTTGQFDHYVRDYLMKQNMVEERVDGRFKFYKMTKFGEEMYQVLKKDHLFKAILQISGKRLQSEDII